MLHIYICVNGISKQNADSTYNLRIPLTCCGFRLQLRIPQQLSLTIHMSHCLDSANLSFLERFCRIHNSKEDQKVAMMWIPRQSWFWPVVESANDAQNAQFGLVMFYIQKARVPLRSQTNNNNYFPDHYSIADNIPFGKVLVNRSKIKDKLSLSSQTIMAECWSNIRPPKLFLMTERSQD